MSLAQGGGDFGCDFVERLSDDLALSVRGCRFYKLGHGAVLRVAEVFIHREFHQIAADVMGWIDRCRASDPASAAGKTEPGQLTWINASHPLCAICERMKDVIRHLPARLLTPDERALVDEWVAGAGDIAEAYVSNRHADDPALYHRIVIVVEPTDGPAYLVHAPTGRDIWIVLTLGRRRKVQRSRTLRAALNSVRPVLVETGLEEALRIPKMI